MAPVDCSAANSEETLRPQPRGCRQRRLLRGEAGYGRQRLAARVSDNSYVGAKQWDVSAGKGPDTADRLFRTM
jgi:hypothetical protein